MMTERQAHRFWAKVDKQPGVDACWLWTGCKHPKGYGRFGLGTRSEGTIYAHRFAYESEHGPVPQPLQLDHLCRIRHCVRPSHLEPVTSRVNLLRGETVTARNAAKTHCIHGHEFTTGNTRIERNGSRRCRTCARQAAYETNLRRPSRRLASGSGSSRSSRQRS